VVPGDVVEWLENQSISEPKNAAASLVDHFDHLLQRLFTV